MQHRPNNLGIYSPVPFTTNIFEEFGITKNTTYKYMWCYKFLCIGMITSDNKLSMVKTFNKSIQYNNQDGNFIFFIKGLNYNSEKIWTCILIKDHQLENFLGDLSLIKCDSMKVKTFSGRNLNTDYFYDNSTVICSGTGKISFSNLRKRLKRECKNSSDISLNNIKFPSNSTSWSRIISGITEIIAIQEMTYGRTGNELC
ncbi:hypothetical protein [Ehrlichia ruminantium]|uniref:hypothetical protein n=1 Tax=Ehrlichia ruminantium TaxID=779 RepID=UPI0015DCBB1D|nr:hypothetical protein [Ehrlichia ruminantium]QLK57875.1 hypothetical protein FDZ59_02535 [Ehrlichia ruminantium]